MRNDLTLNFFVRYRHARRPPYKDRRPTLIQAEPGCRIISLSLLAIALLLPAFCCGQAIRDLPGFRVNSLPRNDDSSSGSVPLGFDANFFGRTYRTLNVNNNGNITFQGPLSTFVPFGLSGADIPIIAAFFADVDTRSSDADAVTYGVDSIDGHRAFGVNYFHVGYYNQHSDRLNTFQLVLIERPDTGSANFDIEFNYQQIQWDLGDAGRGRGDIAAVVGFSNGTSRADSLFQLPGSKSLGAFVDGGPNSLATHHLNSQIPGRYIFQARSGSVSILRITNAVLPEGATAQPYSAPPLNATGGTPPYTWLALDWPSDLELRLDGSTGVMGGTPTHAGVYNVTIQVADQVGTPPAAPDFHFEDQRFAHTEDRTIPDRTRGSHRWRSHNNDRRIAVSRFKHTVSTTFSGYTGPLPQPDCHAAR